MTFNLNLGFASAAGRKPENEDFCSAMLPATGSEDMGSILAIADGVSAGGMGGEAAQTTVVTLVRDYYSTPQTWDTTVSLDRVITAQNTWLTGMNRRRHPAMGLTTLTALVLRGQTYTVAHVGDTRCYLLRQGQLTQITQDHVVNHPDFRHQLLRSVGLEDRLVVDYLQGDMQVGDIFILLTDGVHGSLKERQLLALIADKDAQQASDALLQAALDAGSNDNLTAMVARVLGMQDARLPDLNRAALALRLPPKLRVGEVLDGLTMTAPIADNGINVLYQMRDPASQQLYALKTLHPARAHDPEERAMLVHESWLAHQMQASAVSDHLVRVHDQLPCQPARSAFYVLYDWHGGETLDRMLERQTRLTVTQALQAIIPVLKVLGRMHRQGVIHRDIKPANLHWGDDGVVRVLDLGVALTGHEPPSMRDLHAGTPSYINPEQWGFQSKKRSEAADETPRERADAQSDLFAVGVTLYQLLTGKLPYGEVLPYQVGRYYRDPTAPTRHNPEIPIWLEHVVLKAVARDKALRFETAEEFLLALERGASRPLSAPAPTPLMQRDPTAVWKLALAFSGLFNLMLIYWLLFLPKT